MCGKPSTEIQLFGLQRGPAGLKSDLIHRQRRDTISRMYDANRGGPRVFESGLSVATPFTRRNIMLVCNSAISQPIICHLLTGRAWESYAGCALL
jgi:hypothetical protein